MTYKIELDEEDVKKIIADRFETNIENVELKVIDNSYYGIDDHFVKVIINDIKTI